MIDSRQRSDPAGTTSSRPPRLWARIDTDNCTSTLTESVHDAGVSKPSSDDSSDGQSGRLDACSSTILTWSASSTAMLANLVCSPPRCCLITSSPGAATSSTRQYGGQQASRAPHRQRAIDCRHAEVDARGVPPPARPWPASRVPGAEDGRTAADLVFLPARPAPATRSGRSLLPGAGLSRRPRRSTPRWPTPPGAPQCRPRRREPETPVRGGGRNACEPVRRPNAAPGSLRTS